jgi:hypothetical protein
MTNGIDEWRALQEGTTPESPTPQPQKKGFWKGLGGLIKTAYEGIKAGYDKIEIPDDKDLPEKERKVVKHITLAGIPALFLIAAAATCGHRVPANEPYMLRTGIYRNEEGYYAVRYVGRNGDPDIEYTADDERTLDNAVQRAEEIVANDFQNRKAAPSPEERVRAQRKVLDQIAGRDRHIDPSEGITASGETFTIK